MSSEARTSTSEDAAETSRLSDAYASDNQEILEEAGSDYEPAEEEVIEYARWLGIAAKEDATMLWIAREGLAAPERTDMQARPNACDRRDVHFRMPGFPDLEVQAWFSLIATGLRDVVYDSAKGGAVAGCWHQPPRQKSAPWRRCQDA